MQVTKNKSLAHVPAARRGGALAASLIVATMLAGLGAGLVQVQTAINRRQMAAIDQTRAMYMAEAGLAEAFIALAQGKSGVIATAKQPAEMGGGLFWVEATEGADGQVLLRATGMIGRAHATLESVLERSVSPFGRLGFFGLEEVVLRQGARVLADGDELAMVRSNGDVTLSPTQGESQIEGRVIAGTEGLIAMGPGSHVSAGVEQAKRAAKLPRVEIPDLPYGNLNHALQPARARIGPGGLEVKDLRVRTNQEARLVGPLVLVIGRLQVADLGRLVIDASNGPVVIHVRNKLELDPGSVWQHEAGSASDVTLFIHGDRQAKWQASGVFRGAIIGLEQDFSLNALLDFQGSISVRRLEVQAGVRVRGSAETVIKIAGVPSQPTLVAWQFSDAPEAEILNNLTDPARWLKTHNVQPMQSSDATAETEVSLQYVTKDGAIGVYQGLAQDFDLHLATSFIQQTWMDGLIGEGEFGPAPEPLEPHPTPLGSLSSREDDVDSDDRDHTHKGKGKHKNKPHQAKHGRGAKHASAVGTSKTTVRKPHKD